MLEDWVFNIKILKFKSSKQQLALFSSITANGTKVDLIYVDFEDILLSHTDKKQSWKSDIIISI